MYTMASAYTQPGPTTSTTMHPPVWNAPPERCRNWVWKRTVWSGGPSQTERKGKESKKSKARTGSRPTRRWVGLRLGCAKHQALTGNLLRALPAALGFEKIDGMAWFLRSVRGRGSLPCKEACHYKPGRGGVTGIPRLDRADEMEEWLAGYTTNATGLAIAAKRALGMRDEDDATDRIAFITNALNPDVHPRPVKERDFADYKPNDPTAPMPEGGRKGRRAVPQDFFMATARVRSTVGCGLRRPMRRSA
eukprot:COSAG06_NODE_94_length_24612_cov_12.885041_6_plen_249_part_00